MFYTLNWQHHIRNDVRSQWRFLLISHTDAKIETHLVAIQSKTIFGVSESNIATR